MSSETPWSAFALSAPLAVSTRNFHCSDFRRASVCSLRASTSPQRKSLSRRVGLSLAAAAAAVGLTVFGTGGGRRVRVVRAAPAGAEVTVDGKEKKLRYDGKQELGGVEKAASLGLTGGAFAVLAFIAHRKGREEDALEMVRIKEEVERLEKLKAEFEVDDDGDEDGEFTGVDDDEFMKQLNKRILSGEESGDGDDGEDGETDGGVTTVGRSGGGKDGDDGNNGGDGEGDSGGDGANDVEALKRMWAAESPDGSGKGNSGK